jgi:hypothetical protein
VEARARLVAGRAVEHLATDLETLATVATLVEGAGDAEGFLERMSAVRGEVRAAFEGVASAGTIGVLDS